MRGRGDSKLHCMVLLSHNAQCVVLADAQLDVHLRISDYCHANGIHYVGGACSGLFGWLFVDMGEDFRIFDHSGESTVQTLVADVSSACPAVVTALLMEKKVHGFQDGDHVRLNGLKGLEELNGNLYRIKGAPRI